MRKKGVPFDPDGGSKGRQRRRVERLADGYVRTVIKTCNPEISQLITPELIEMQRQAMLLKRLSRQLSKTFKELNHES